jgi:hypothetical protein
VQSLQHQPVAAQRDDDIRLAGAMRAMEAFQTAARQFGLRRRRGNEG